MYVLLIRRSWVRVPPGSLRRGPIKWDLSPSGGMLAGPGWVRLDNHHIRAWFITMGLGSRLGEGTIVENGSTHSWVNAIAGRGQSRRFASFRGCVGTNVGMLRLEEICSWIDEGPPRHSWVEMSRPGPYASGRPPRVFPASKPSRPTPRQASVCASGSSPPPQGGLRVVRDPAPKC